MHTSLDRKHKFAALLLSAVFLFVLCVPAFADQGEAIGNFEQGTGESSRVENSGTEDGEQLITLSGGVSYSPDTGLFYRDVENSRFGINVPDGAIVTGTVAAELAPSLTGVLYKNGNEIEGADLSYITAPGKYVLAVTANDSTQTARVSFTILTSPTGNVKEYKMPPDFFVVSATLDGEPASYSQTYVDMSGEGLYEISYRSPEADRDMMLSVTVDHTPPTVTLTGLTDGKANGPVTVSDVEEGAKVYLIRNGKQSVYTGTITETGSYSLTVKDEAGNETTYDFVVVTYANSSFKVLIATLAVLIIALVGYIIYYRKYIRVS